METKNYSSTFLLPKMSFLIGVWSVLGISGWYLQFKTSETGAEADKLAMENDFGMVGNDMRDSMSEFKSENSDVLKTN